MHWVAKCVKHFLPARKIRFAAFKPKLFNGNRVKPFFVKHHGNGVKNIAVVVFNNAFFFHIAEKRDFVSYIIGKRVLRAAHDNIRVNTQRKHFFNAVLSGL